MSGRTHAMVGANAVWIAALFVPVDRAFPILIAVGAFAGLLPDIDAVSAKIHFLGGGVLGAFRNIFKHRGFFHSLLAVAGLFLFAAFFLSGYHPALPVVLATGYASHLFIDGFNKKRTRYFFPLKKSYRFLHEELCSPIGGSLDQLFFILGAAGIFFFLFSHVDQFQGGVPNMIPFSCASPHLSFNIFSFFL